MSPSEVVMAYTIVSELPAAYRLSKIFTGSSSGALTLLALVFAGMQKKLNGAVKSVPAIFLAAWLWAKAGDFSALGVGAGRGGPARNPVFPTPETSHDQTKRRASLS